MMYEDDQLLMLSGIQHYMYCPRQWALIHIEQLWGENRLTAEGYLQYLVHRRFKYCYRASTRGQESVVSRHKDTKKNEK